MHAPSSRLCLQLAGLRRTWRRLWRYERLRYALQAAQLHAPPPNYFLLNIKFFNVLAGHAYTSRLRFTSTTLVGDTAVVRIFPHCVACMQHISTASVTFVCHICFTDKCACRFVPHACKLLLANWRCCGRLMCSTLLAALSHRLRDHNARFALHLVIDVDE